MERKFVSGLIKVNLLFVFLDCSCLLCLLTFTDQVNDA